MKKIVIFLFLLQMQFSIANCMRRDFIDSEFCVSHLKYGTLSENVIPYLNLIPPISEQCWHVTCSKCHNVYIYDNLDDESYEDEDCEIDYELYWSCDCIPTYCIKPWQWMKTWTRCKNKSLYSGYFSHRYTKSLPLFESFLSYISLNQNCSCYWPEKAVKARKINNIAYRLFSELIEQTSLISIVKHNDEQKMFLSQKYNQYLNLHGVTISCVCHTFLYSHYMWICQDIENYCYQKFLGNDLYEILEKLDNIRLKLALLFYPIYNDCYKSHPSTQIQQELLLLHNDFGIDDIVYNQTSSYNQLLEQNYSEFFQSYRRCPATEFSLMNTENAKTKEKINTFNQIDFYDSKTNCYELQCDYSHNFDNIVNQSQKSEFDVLLSLGTLYNDFLMYGEAIEVLNLAISINPKSKEAYIERASAYFELGKIDDSLNDYQTIKQLKDIKFPFYDIAFQPNEFYKNASIYDFSKEDFEFSQGFVVGTGLGFNHALKAFIPEGLDCLRGLFHGIWALTCDPKNVSKDIYLSLYDLVNFLRNETSKEILKTVVPELRALCEEWDCLCQFEKGKRTGFIVGKYGVDVFAPGAASKVYKKYRHLKRMNTVTTLELCSASKSQKNTIANKALDWAKKRAYALNSVAKNRVIPRNSNVIPHVMQEKHEWSKLIKLSGNVEDDFKKVINLLEKNEILAEKNFASIISSPICPTNIQIKLYEININNEIVNATFTHYIKTDQVFLNNAYVIKK